MSLSNKNWCFTLQASDESVGRGTYLPPTLNEAVLQYCVWQEESCPETGRIHLQGFLQMKVKTTMKRVKESIFSDSPHVHLETMRGTPHDCYNYCTKEESRVDGPWEFGKMITQGARTDLSGAVARLKASGWDMRSLVDTHPMAIVQYQRGMSKLAEIARAKDSSEGKELTREVETFVYFGETGTGKTYSAVTEHKDVFKLSTYDRDRLWFDGYYGQKTLVIDEFSPRRMDLFQLLQICDRYELNVPTKGGHAAAKWNRVIITSNLDPSTWYVNANAEHRRALFRRIKGVKQFVRPVDQDDSEVVLPKYEQVTSVKSQGPEVPSLT